MNGLVPRLAGTSVSPDLFRQAFRHLAGGVTIITAASGAGPVGLAATSCTSVSAEPPLVLVSLGRCSGTLSTIVASKVFGVSLLGADQCWISRRFARNGSTDKFAGVPLVESSMGFPLIEGSLAHLECELHQLVPAGDHVLVVGHVAAGTVGAPGTPLVYAYGGYHGLEATSVS